MQRRLSRLAPVVGAIGAAACLAACGAGSPAATTRTAASALTATGTVANYVKPPAGIAAIQLFRPMAMFTGYVEVKLGQLHPQLSTLDRALAAGDVTAARRDWLAAHTTWLEIGEDDGQYGAFGPFGNAIDGNADGLIGGTSSGNFTGFHKVELELFRRSDVTAATADAARLTSLVDSITPTVVNQDFELNSTSLDGWVLRAHEILEDALRDSLSQDDNYGSNSDLASVRADVSATHEMVDILSGLIEPRSPGLVPTAIRQLRAVNVAVAAAPSGREPSALALRTRQRINADVSAALETLAPVSELMTISNSNS